MEIGPIPQRQPADGLCFDGSEFGLQFCLGDEQRVQFHNNPSVQRH